MLHIRQELYDILRAPQQAQFIQRTLNTIQQGSPDVFQEKGEAAVRRSIQHAIGQGEVYGLMEEHQVLRLLAFMLALGDGFMQAPDFPWAKTTLQDDSLSPTEKLNALDQQIEAALQDE